MQSLGQWMPHKLAVVGKLQGVEVKRRGKIGNNLLSDNHDLDLIMYQKMMIPLPLRVLTHRQRQLDSGIEVL